MTPSSSILSEPGLGQYRKSSPIRPLRIAMLSIHSSPLGELGTGDTGGMSVYVRELSCELGRAGHLVDIYTCAEDSRQGPEIFISGNVRVIHLSIGQSAHVTKEMLAEHLPEVFRSLEACNSANHIRYDLIHSHYWLSGLAGRLAQDRWLAPHVVMFHTTGIAKRIACGEEHEPAQRLAAEKKLAHTSDRILTATEREREQLIRHYRVPGEKIGMVPCGVNTERFRPVPRDLARRELGLQDAGYVVLYVGRFAPVKGLDRLIAAAAHLRSCRGLTFVIIGGDGLQSPASTELRRLAKKASVENIVRFQGRVEHELLPLYYSAADVLIVPSYYESFGMVALESLACGTPVIAARVGAMDDLIRNGKTGLLVETPGPGSFASAISKSISDWNVTISREEIRASVLGYDWSHIASSVTEQYAEVLGSRAALRSRSGPQGFEDGCLG